MDYEDFDFDDEDEYATDIIRTLYIRMFERRNGNGTFDNNACRQKPDEVLPRY